MPPIRASWLWIAVVLLLLPLRPVEAGEKGTLRLTARFACGETLRGQRAAAVEAEIENRGSEFEGELRFRPVDGSFESVVKVKIPSQSTHRVLVPFFAGDPGAIRGQVRLCLPEGGQEIDSCEVIGMVMPKLGVFLEVGRGRNFGLQRVISDKDYSPNNHVTSLDPNDFPDMWEGLDPFDVIVLDSAAFAGFTSAQQDAVRNWVLRGGTLVAVTQRTGPDWSGTFAASLLSLELRGRSEGLSSGALGRFARLSGGAIIGNPEGIGWQSGAARAGKTLIMEGIDHLACRGRLGRGTVFFFSFDPSGAGFRDWPGLPHFWKVLLASWLHGGQARTGEPSWRAAEDEIFAHIRPDARYRPPVFWVMVAVVLYALLIGPVEYWVLKRLRRQHLTVFTFPVSVVLATAVAGFAAIRLGGASVTVTEMSVEDVDPDTGDSAADSWVAVWSPRRARISGTSGGGFASGATANAAPGSIFGSAAPSEFNGKGGFDAVLTINQARFFRLQGVRSRSSPPLRVSVRVERGLVNGIMRTVDYRIDVSNGLETGLSGCAVLSDLNPLIGSRALILKGSVAPGESKTFSLRDKTVEARPLDRWLDEIESRGDAGSGYDAMQRTRDVMFRLSFLRVKTQGDFEEQLLKRGLSQRETLRTQAAVFAGWADDPGPVFTIEGARTAAASRSRLVRMDVSAGLETAGTGEQAQAQEQEQRDGDGGEGSR